ncbi:outer membrane protein [Azorhizobium doebereinerae]|uniref:outer membrane protein n=1 Tax=Azorhizobium doebereinerae TaxID=281091 RepID=UPI00049037F3|nr:outer membrane beta-barrel protein [Azorhizobium doebereinerae]
MRFACALVIFLALGGGARAADPDLPALGRAGDFNLNAPDVDEPEDGATGWYLRTTFGASGVRATPSGIVRGNTEDKRARLAGAGVGYRFLPWLRGDLTVDYAGAISATRPAGTADLSTGSMMANLYWDMFTFGNLTPYVGAGVGFGMAHFKFSPYFGPSRWGETDVGLAWNVSAGIGWTLTEHLTLDVGYRYAAMGSPSFSGPTGQPFSLDDMVTHQARIGLRYTFR